MNKKLFRNFVSRLNSAGLPVTREAIEFLWHEMHEKTAAGFAFLAELHREIVPAEQVNENWEIPSRLPIMPLGENNPAFPAGYFDKF